jgi:hypothetical protein
MEMMKAATEGDRLHRLRQAIATVNIEPLRGKDATEQAATAAAVLTAAIVKETMATIEDDDDRFVAGTFAFVFSNYFAHLLAGNFEIAASLAVMEVLGVDEFERCFNTVQESYNRMVRSNAKVPEAIGKTCETWFKNPTPSQFARLCELFKLLRSHAQQR